MTWQHVKEREIKMIYGYARVSTAGQSLASQVETLKENGVQEENIFKEKITGTNTERPEFKKLLSILEKDDTLVITKLDRFARSTKDALETIEQLFNDGITVKILNLGTIENTPTGRLIFTVFSAFADFERDLIVERTQEGKAQAKLNPNFKEGRPKRKLTKQYLHALEVLENNTYKETAELTGISTATLSRIKKQYEDEKALEEMEIQ